MGKRVASKLLRVMTNTAGSLGWSAACAYDDGVLALVDRSRNGSDHTEVLPVLLDQQGQVFHVGEDLDIDSPRLADAVPVGEHEALIAVMSRPHGIGLLGVPHFYRCSTRGGQLRVKKLGAWRGGASILSSSFFAQHERGAGSAALFAESTKQALRPGWKLAYGSIGGATKRPELQRVVPTPSENVGSIAAAMVGEGKWMFAAAVGNSERIELWHDPGTGQVKHRATLATSSTAWREVSCPRIVRRPSGFLVLWRAWNGRMRSDLRDGAIWYVETDSDLRSISPAMRWSPDRVVPASGIRICDHEGATSIFWQNGLSAVRSPVRWSVLRRDTALPAEPQSIGAPLPGYIVQTKAGFVALRDSFRMEPYEWGLTTELLGA